MLVKLSDIPRECSFRLVFLEIVSGNPLVDWLARIVNHWGHPCTLISVFPGCPAKNGYNLIRQMDSSYDLIQRWGLDWGLFIPRCGRAPVLSVWDRNFGPSPESPACRPDSYIQVSPLHFLRTISFDNWGLLEKRNKMFLFYR